MDKDKEKIKEEGMQQRGAVKNLPSRIICKDRVNGYDY